MTIEEACAGLPQHHGVVPPRWVSTMGNGPTTAINSLAINGALTSQIVGEAHAVWDESDVPFFSGHIVGHSPTHSRPNPFKVRSVLEGPRVPTGGCDLDAGLSDLAQVADEAREDGF